MNFFKSFKMSLVFAMSLFVMAYSAQTFAKPCYTDYDDVAGCCNWYDSESLSPGECHGMSEGDCNRASIRSVLSSSGRWGSERSSHCKPSGAQE